MKLWSYGDSHSAGHELCQMQDLGKSWLQDQFGFSDRVSAKKKMGEKFYKKKIREEWYSNLRQQNLCSLEIFGNPCSPELSFAGQLANLKEYQLINRARPGSSNDQILFRLFEDNSSWQKNDFILVSIVTPFRFAPQYDPLRGNFQPHTMPKSAQTMFAEYGPCEKSFKLWTQSIVHLAKKLHPNLHCIRTTDTDCSLEGQDFSLPSMLTDLPLSSFAEQQFPGEPLRYPGGHFCEKVHLAYAKHLATHLQEVHL